MRETLPPRAPCLSCHSAAPGSGPAGGQSPRPAPTPPPAGAGFCPFRSDRSGWHCPEWAGETRVAFPVPARTDDSTFTASMAGAIAPAMAPRRDQDRPGPKAPGQRPPRPRRALRPRRVGRRPLSFLELAVDRKPSRAGGKTRPAFQGPVRRGNPLPQTGKNSPQAGGRIAVSAACQGVACQSRNRLVIQHRMTGRHGMQTANARPVPDGSDRASGVGVRLAVPGRWTRHVVVKPRCRSDRVSRAPS